MVIGIFGESCVGKSTIAAQLEKELSARVFTGKDYLRLDKNEDTAKAAFVKLLEDEENTIVYVIAEMEHLALLPQKAFRVLVTAELDTIKERFAMRTGGHLPPPVAQMLERKHGMFDNEPCDIHIGDDMVQNACVDIMKMLNRGNNAIA